MSASSKACPCTLSRTIWGRRGLGCLATTSPCTVGRDFLRWSRRLDNPRQERTAVWVFFHCGRLGGVIQKKLAPLAPFLFEFSGKQGKMRRAGQNEIAVERE